MYLSNREAATPLGNTTLDIEPHGNVVNLPLDVLPSQQLAYGVVLGLHFIYQSQLQINVIDHLYTFKATASCRYNFQCTSQTEAL